MDCGNIQLDVAGTSVFVKLFGMKPRSDDGCEAVLTRMVQHQKITCFPVKGQEYKCTTMNNGRDISESLAKSSMDDTAHRISDADKKSIISQYRKETRYFFSGKYRRIFSLMDRNIRITDVHGKRMTLQDIRPLSRQFFSSIRNARVKFRIYNMQSDGNRIAVHFQSKLRFDLRTGLVLVESWEPKLKIDMSLAIWQEKAGRWVQVESRGIRPERLVRGTPYSSRAARESGVVLLQLGPCPNKCSETLVACGVSARRHRCVSNYNACIAACRRR
jgi:hypothetical protein